MAVATSSAAAPGEATIVRRPGNGALLGAVGAVVGGAVLLAAVGGAYISVRTGLGKDFVPAEMKFNNYAAFMVMVSGVLASLAAEFALVSIKVSQRRWVSGGYALSMLMGAAGMNLVWFIGSHLELAVASSAYATMVYALLGVAVLLFGVAIAATLVAFVVALSGHASAANPTPARAANWFVHLATLGWVAVYALIFLYK